MTASSPPLATIKKVFHPSDFTPASETAFGHALKIALLAKADLTLLHVAEHDGAHWSEFPGVREWLERWRLIPPGSGRQAVSALGLAIHKVIAHSNDVLRACLHYLSKHPTDLVVLAAQQRESRAQWPLDSTEPMTHGGQWTLFLPEAQGGFVNGGNGVLQLRRIVVSIKNSPSAQQAVDTAARFARTLKLTAAEFILVHIGERTTIPAVQTPAVPGWNWRCDVRDGPVADGILAALREHSADLIVMATDGQHGFLDALRGNVTERILREGHCPLLAVPGSSAS